MQAFNVALGSLYRVCNQSASPHTGWCRCKLTRTLRSWVVVIPMLLLLGMGIAIATVIQSAQCDRITCTVRRQGHSDILIVLVVFSKFTLYSLLCSCRLPSRLCRTQAPRKGHAAQRHGRARRATVSCGRHICDLCYAAWEGSPAGGALCLHPCHLHPCHLSCHRLIQRLQCPWSLDVHRMHPCWPKLCFQMSERWGTSYVDPVDWAAIAHAVFKCNAITLWWFK